MHRRIVLAFAVSLCLTPAASAQYVNVRLSVSAPEYWQKAIENDLKIKLNSIPDVMVVDKQSPAAFTVEVDVNAVTDGDGDVIGYSLAEITYGTYDQEIMKIVIDTMEKEDKDGEAMAPFLRYVVSGNVYLTDFFHTHGPLKSIDGAYSEIAGRLKSTSLPEYRKMQRIVESLVKATGSTKPTAKSM